MFQINNFINQISLIYTLASIFYLIIQLQIGTPLNDAIQKYPVLKKISENAHKTRLNIFLCSIVISILLLHNNN